MVDVVTSARSGTSYVEWGAVFAGALAATAISFVLLTAGAAIGLSLVSPYESESYGRLAGLLAVFWAIAVPILAFLVGGYIAGRMRSAWDAAASDEVQFRDGIHGLLVWSLSIVAGGVLAFVAASTAAQTSAQVAAQWAIGEPSWHRRSTRYLALRWRKLRQLRPVMRPAELRPDAPRSSTQMPDPQFRGLWLLRPPRVS